MAIVVGIATLAVALALIPRWYGQRSSEKRLASSQSTNPANHYRSENQELLARLREREAALEDLRAELARAKDSLNYPYV